jgi:hypothetical protein
MIYCISKSERMDIVGKDIDAAEKNCWKED